MVLELVKNATGAGHASIVKSHGLGMYTVLTSSTDNYGRTVMRRYRAVVQGEKLAHLRGL